jgi:hypothetical protein
LITQIGFVAKVEQAPAVMEAYILANHLLSISDQYMAKPMRAPAAFQVGNQ